MYDVVPIGFVRSTLADREASPSRPDRPNPIGIHRVRIVDVESPLQFRVADLEAFDGTPIPDVKPVLDRSLER
ncbi:MAG TPA: TrmO family methyltransferase [Gemmatimonadaceae bacterium]|nr:TrmO family methyltransferase [Gemmatimonadaceae bacterium]